MNGDRSIAELLEVVRRRLWLIGAVAVLTVGSAAAFTFTRPPVFRAEMKIVVGQGQGIFRPETGNVTEPFTQTMSDLLESQVVARAVIDSQGLDLGPSELLDRLDVSARPQTAVLEVTYDDEDPARAEQVLAEVGEVFTGLVAQVLSPGGSGEAGVTATVFDPAHALSEPVWPRELLILGVSAPLGILLGVALAFLREQFDDTIRSAEAAELAFGAPAVASMPPGFLGNKPLVGPRRARRGLDPVLREMAMQRLRAGVLWSLPEQAKVVVVASAHEQEGKSTLAAGLALALSRAGRTVVVVDADLHRPTLHDYLGVPLTATRPAFDDVVAGRATLEDALIWVPSVPGGLLKAIFAVPGRPAPTELRLDAVRAALASLASKADVVIVDAPPLGVVTDAYPLVASADAVVAAVRLGRSTKRGVTELKQLLGRLQAPKAELVLTDVEQAGSAYYYGPAKARTGH